MKRDIVSAAVFLGMLLTGCDKDTDSAPVAINGSWQLFKQYSANSGVGALESTPSYKEVYTFSPDSTFTRIRKEEGWAATGSYTLRRFGQEEYLELSYNEAGIPTGCSYGKTYIQQDSNDLLVENNLSCNGPSLYFKRVQSNK